MDKILRMLYEGKINPLEQNHPKTREHIKRQKEFVLHFDAFQKKLEGPLNEEFEKLRGEEQDLTYLEYLQMFIDGFRFGVRMMIEVYEDMEQE